MKWPRSELSTNPRSEARQRLGARMSRPYYSPKKWSESPRQGTVSRHVSAYQLHVPEAIHNLEALLLRSFVRSRTTMPT